MAAASTDELSLLELLETQGPCTACLDAAVEYIRLRIAFVLPLYAVAMLPFSIVVLLIIDATTAGQKSLAATYCIYLTAATLWRWIWLARLQQKVQADVQGQHGDRLPRRVVSIVMVRLLANCAMTWGSLLAAVPSFYGLFVGSFAAPLLLEGSGPASKRVGQSLKWIHRSAHRLVCVVAVMFLLAGLLTVAILVGEAIMLQVALPSLLGQDTSDLSLTTSSWAWRMSVLYFVFLVLDGIWTVASVILHYESQSRRTATDLVLRLRRVLEKEE